MNVLLFRKRKKNHQIRQRTSGTHGWTAEMKIGGLVILLPSGVSVQLQLLNRILRTEQ